MSAARDIELPLRPCATWCISAGDGHREQHPVDRMCVSAYRTVLTTARKPVELDRGQWVYDSLDVCTWWKPDAAEPQVVIANETTSEDLPLKATEARELAAALLEAADRGGGPDRGAVMRKVGAVFEGKDAA